MAYKTNIRIKKYKLRAEGLNDVMQFVRDFYLSIEKYTIYGNTHTMDVELEFTTNAPVDKIMKYLRDIPDSQVMRETLEIKSKYTGKR